MKLGPMLMRGLTRPLCAECTDDFTPSKHVPAELRMTRCRRCHVRLTRRKDVPPRESTYEDTRAEQSRRYRARLRARAEAESTWAKAQRARGAT